MHLNNNIDTHTHWQLLPGIRRHSSPATRTCFHINVHNVVCTLYTYITYGYGNLITVGNHHHT